MSWLKDKLKLRKQLKELSSTKTLLEAHLKELLAKKDEVNKDVFEVIQFLLEEIIDIYGSMHAVYRRGYFISCLILSRPLLESSVNLMYVLKEDSEKRAKNFKLFPSQSHLKRMNSVEDSFWGKEELIDNLEKVTKEYEPTGANNRNWDGKSIKEMFEYLKLGSIYRDWYTRLSDYTHPKYKFTRDLKIKRPYNDFLRDLIFRHILIITLESLKLLNEKYDLLEGVIIIRNYPHKNADFFFSINTKNQ